MRDLDALLNSLVNIDRKSLIAILSSEAEAARQLVSARNSDSPFAPSSGTLTHDGNAE